MIANLCRSKGRPRRGLVDIVTPYFVFIADFSFSVRLDLISAMSGFLSSAVISEQLIYPLLPTVM